MRKLLILLFLATVIAFFLSACGGGSSADPLGTDSITFTGAGAVGRNGTLVLTATMKNVSGVAVASQDVSFRIVTNESAATLSTGATRTDNTGTATVIYRAGGVSGVDIVRAYITNNPNAYQDIFITVGTGGTGEVTLSVTPNILSLSAGTQSIITAEVLNADGKPAAGQTVTFTTAPSGSGALDPTPGSSKTNAAGKAFATYTAGSLLPGSKVFDVVTASVTTAGGDSAAEVLITRTAATGTGGITVTVTPNLSSLRAGSQTIITADVLNADGTPAVGETVTFTTDPSNSGAADPTPGTSVTNAVGKAFATYTAGNNSPGTTVYDVVTASVAGTASGVIITRTAAAGTGTITMTVTPSLTSLGAGGQSIIAANVLNADGTPATGKTVTFKTSPSNSGAADPTPASSLTNADGKAFATYTAGSLLPGTTVFDVVTASLTDAAGDAAGDIIITRTAAAGTGGVTMTVTPSLTSLSAGSQSIIAAKVLNADGTPAEGQTVTFTTSPSNSGALSPTPGSSLTNSDGMAFATYTAGNNSSGSIVFDVVTASVTDAAASATITRTAVVGTGNQLAFTADPVTLPATGGNSVLTAIVTAENGSPVAIATVTFSILTGPGTLTDPSGTAGATLAVTTDTNGKAWVVFTGGATPGDTAIQASITGRSKALVISW